MKILLIEDDELIAERLVQELTNQNYTIEIASDGQAGLEQATFTYDLILLDVMLPKLDGISICRQLRSQGVKTPILLLTAQDASNNKVKGLDAGADDYLTKPFDWQELSARIRALLRRGSPTTAPLLQWGDLQLDPSICEVMYQGQPIPLTPKEYGLLELFLRNPQRVFSRSVILDHLWSYEEFPGEETVTAHIKGLRQKLKKAGLEADPIETVYGIGYRLRAFKQQTSKQKKKTRRKPISPEVEQKAVEAALVVWQRVRAKLSSRIDAIEQATTAILNDTLKDELRQRAISEAHKLAGSLGMFDLDEGSRLAKEIEQIFQRRKTLNQQQKQHLSKLIVAMRQELEQATQEQLPDSLSVDEKPLLLLVEPDQSLARVLVKEAATEGMPGEVVSNSTAAREWISHQRPEIVLLDLADAAASENDLNLIGELSACTPPIPVLILTAQASLLDRVKLARLGGRGFLQKPLPPTQIVEAIAQVQKRIRRTEAKVMVVDDDPLILKTLHNLLLAWGIRLFTLEDPLQFWSALETFAPDLLILDVEMPHLNGIELCQVVRNDLRWAGLPILFLTVHNDSKTKQQVFEAGGDDYVSKPIVAAELVTRILNRLERSHLLRTIAETDPLTGVANRQQSTQDLTQLLHLAKRCHQTLCFALLDLDCLKQINDRSGYAVGDRVLSRLGKLLRQHFQSEDVIARWGGAKFMVSMYGMNCNEGLQRLLELRETLKGEKFTTGDDCSFPVTFSAGVVQYPQAGSNWQELSTTAKALLLQALAMGGNQILSAKEYPPCK